MPSVRSNTEEWGHCGWVTIVWMALLAHIDPWKRELWESIMSDLAYFLPCSICSKEAQAYIQQHPLPGHDPIEYVRKFYNDVQSRVKDPKLAKTDKERQEIQHARSIPFSQIIWKIQNFSDQLCLMDVYRFLTTCLLVCCAKNTKNLSSSQSQKKEAEKEIEGKSIRSCFLWLNACSDIFPLPLFNRYPLHCRHILSWIQDPFALIRCPSTSVLHSLVFRSTKK
jgi:hypothetical protein